MARVHFICGVLLCVGLLGLISQGQTTAPAGGDQDAQSMLQAYHAMQAPQPDMSRVKDQAYVESYLKAVSYTHLDVYKRQLYHYLGPETFTWKTCLFRTLAGIYFGGIFICRGFGVTAGCHAIYDIMILSLAATS